MRDPGPNGFILTFFPSKPHARNNVTAEVTQKSTEAEAEKGQRVRAEEIGTVLSRAGEVLLLSPGGVREALFSDEYYSVLWGKRRGFARIAIKARRPIYPVFTENIREGIRLVQYGKCSNLETIRCLPDVGWLRRLYEFTRLPFGLFYGYFPVKLRTYIGDPIYPREGETDEQLADRVRVMLLYSLRRCLTAMSNNPPVALTLRLQEAVDRWPVDPTKKHRDIRIYLEQRARRLI
ncbi:unnamed protein product, partial [Hydatigera taeniaeformis]|uniref:PlsC domain-containing protein n=1 Tax=Hydatigena taeniaeformis TaxID=6205 RepID=A0A0R3XAZ5_HYDTA